MQDVSKEQQQACLQETDFFDLSHDVVKDFVKQHLDKQLSEKELAIKLYLAVRDGWRYDAYDYHTSPEGLKASAIMQRDHGHCLDKSIILISCYRAVGLPARLHLAKVKNHIAAERLVERYGTDQMAPHGYVEVFVDGRWVACTPAFNKTLCEMLKVEVLEFDGENDSIFQAFDNESGKFMEYLDDYGSFADFPYDFVIETLEAHYPQFKELRAASPEFHL